MPPRRAHGACDSRPPSPAAPPPESDDQPQQADGEAGATAAGTTPPAATGRDVLFRAGVRQELGRVVASAALADVGRIGTRGADARIRLADTVLVGIAPLTLLTGHESTRIVDARSVGVAAGLAERTRMTARIGLAAAEPTALARRARDVRTAAVALAGDAVLIRRAHDD